MVIVTKEMEAVAQRRTRTDMVKAEAEGETQYVIVTTEDKALYMIWAKEEEKTHTQMSGHK